VARDEDQTWRVRAAGLEGARSRGWELVVEEGWETEGALGEVGMGVRGPCMDRGPGLVSLGGGGVSSGAPPDCGRSLAEEES